MAVVCEDVKVRANVSYGGDAWRMTLAVPGDGPYVPGQFVHLRCAPERDDPLLRRPFSIYTVRRRGRTTDVDVLYDVVGRGTAILAERKPGDRVGFLGPLGVGFAPDPSADAYAMVAGGVGIVPFLHLAQEIRRRRLRGPVLLFFGARTRAALWGLHDFRALGGITIKTATLDGTAGHRGLVTEPFTEWLRTGGISPSRLQVFTCGPLGMLEAVARLCRREGIPCQVSMERRMGCGVGVCGACVTPVLEPGAPVEEWHYDRICVKGPCMGAERLHLDAAADTGKPGRRGLPTTNRQQPTNSQRPTSNQARR